MDQTAQSSKESKQDKSAQSHLGYRQSGQILEDHKTPERTICKQFTDCTRKEKRSGRLPATGAEQRSEQRPAFCFEPFRSSTSIKSLRRSEKSKRQAYQKSAERCSEPDILPESARDRRQPDKPQLSAREEVDCRSVPKEKQ